LRRDEQDDGGAEEEKLNQVRVRFWEVTDRMTETRKKVEPREREGF